MATIHLTAQIIYPGYGGGGGPSVATAYDPHLVTEAIFGPEKTPVPVIWLTIGNDSLRIWPVYPDEIEAFGQRLIEIADTLRKVQR
jgi:hypothetical protein